MLLEISALVILQIPIHTGRHNIENTPRLTCLPCAQLRASSMQRTRSARILLQASSLRDAQSGDPVGTTDADISSHVLTTSQGDARSGLVLSFLWITMS